MTTGSSCFAEGSNPVESTSPRTDADCPGSWRGARDDAASARIDHDVIATAPRVHVPEHEAGDPGGEDRRERRREPALSQTEAGVPEDHLLKKAPRAGHEVHRVVARRLRQHQEGAAQVTLIAVWQEGVDQ